MLVKVTQEHIDKGRQAAYTERICSNCPIALALKDAFKVQETFASYNTLRVGQFPENLVFEITTPDNVFRWMSKFDTDYPVEPFEFELSLEGVKL